MIIDDVSERRMNIIFEMLEDFFLNFFETLILFEKCMISEKWMIIKRNLRFDENFSFFFYTLQVNHHAMLTSGLCILSKFFFKT